MATSHVILANLISNTLVSLVKLNNVATCSFFRALLPSPSCTFTVEIY